jgi:aminopeptidase N
VTGREERLRRVRRQDYRPPAYQVEALALNFELDPEATRVTSDFTFRRVPGGVERGESACPPLVLDGESQTDVTVRLDGVPLPPDRYLRDAQSLTVLAPPGAGRLTVQGTIRPAANVALEGLYVSSGVFCTQCEPEGFRRIAYFPDRPDVLARYTVTLVAERSRYPVLLSNGNRIGAGDAGSGRHYATWHDPFPKPTYLFALVAGNLAALSDEFTTASGRPVALEIWSTPQNLERCRHAMASLKRAMRWDEERYGREYDLDTFMIFCADDFNLGAMENKGLNIFNSKVLLAQPETATDDDYRAIEGVVAHEYFHNWTGNRVTCRDWFQLSLKEGLTVFRDQEFSGDMGSRAVERIAAVDYLRSVQFAEDAGPMAHPVRPDEYKEINNFYTATVYEKGAELIRMQHTLLGAATFRRGMDLYFARHDGRAVTCDDFVAAMHDASLEAGGPGLDQFKRWYSQAGTPVVRARGSWDAASRAYTLELEQRTPATPGHPYKEPFHVPLAVGLVGPDGRDLPLRLEDDTTPAVTTRVLGLTLARQAFRFVDVPVAPVPSLNRGFSAPVRVEFDYAPAELLRLAAHDSDDVNRWDAAQRCFTSGLREQAARHARGAALELDPPLAALARALLADTGSDPALIALALTLPSLDYVAGLAETIDVGALVASREFTLRAIAGAARAAFEQRYATTKPTAPYAPTEAQAGPRRLRNVCLRYLGALDDPAACVLAQAQYDASDNMTDSIAALAAVNHGDSPQRADLFARFESAWRDEPLVLDKWFALQAVSHRPDTLDRVRMLLAHPKFNAKNPNRVRSLVAAFALRNWPGFHAADGSGYAFVADQVLALDPVNPQIAANVATAFNLWRRHTEPRRSLQRAALERIAGAASLSPDVSEIIERALAD